MIGPVDERRVTLRTGFNLYGTHSFGFIEMLQAAEAVGAVPIIGMSMDETAEDIRDFVEYVRPEGGLFIWCKLPDHVDMLEFVKKAVDKKVAVVPGNAFLMNDSDNTQYIRLNFSTPSDEGIVNGVRALGEVAREYKS